MNFVKRIIEKLLKKDEIKELPQKEILKKENNRNEYIKYLRENTKQNENKKVKMLVCMGDGLGIDRKISY